MYIAVIEEELLIRDMLHYALELSGHQVDIYSEMPEHCRAYDLAIVEPGEYGQGFPAISQLIRGYHIPVLILTFYESNMGIAREYSLPAINKMPFRLPHLLKSISRFGRLNTPFAQPSSTRPLEAC
ncbi:DNA-binding response regulator [Ktedonospora formicarum]|uniref:Response regulatory domain-containing protein n=1 Tax=Ktedonospora formicarum TaxID=2778364 RepID=A0A8J3HU50_9CHLR|nr:DNA-binding response regulator [Ktedonospora formicarum]GHO43326.1 hypothetical protein KSX_14890 [Ktedonospora formicarum]